MSSRLFIEPIGSLAELSAAAEAADLSAVEAVVAEHRRREILAWRAIVRREVGGDAEIGYDESGAPIITGSQLYVGVSHSRDNVAVVLSDRVCAVDIESPTRDFSRVASRYLTAEERAISSHTDFLAVAWCAKETLYKYYRRGGVDFLKDIKIVALDIARGEVCGTLPDGEVVEMSIARFGGDVVVYTR